MDVVQASLSLSRPIKESRMMHIRGIVRACPGPSGPRLEPASGPYRGRRGRAGWVIVLVLAATGAAVLAFFGFVRPLGQAPQGVAQATGNGSQAAATPPGAPASAQGQPRAVSIAPDKAEVRTRLVILRSGEGSNTRSVVALGRPEVSPEIKDRLGSRQPILERELIRQAILSAARDEMGLSTRDELLDDVPPGASEGPPLEIVTLFRPNECHLLVRRGAGEKAEILLQHDLGTRPDNSRYTPELTALSETLARSEFPALLKRLGLKAQPNQKRDDATVPAEAEERLDQLGLVDSYAAVRALHESIRGDGESQARLAALARAYAQLGTLTEYQWSPAHRVFKARALLYAQRLAARNPSSAAALRGRGFVWALVGRHDLALADLEAANRMAGESKDASQAPSWLPVIDAYLKADREQLAKTEGRHSRLAALLGMMSIQYPRRTRLLATTAVDLAKHNPDCTLAYDAIFQNGQLGELHVSTVAGPEAFTKLFPDRLKWLKSLPEAVKQALDQGRAEPDLVAALDLAGRHAADQGEPTWGVLAHLAREARFVQAYQRLDFMANMWHVPAGDALEGFRPLVAGHRFFPYLEYIVHPRRGGANALNRMAEQLDLAEVEFTERPLIDALREMKLPAGEDAARASQLHISILVRDVSERLRQTNATRDHLARILLNISPFSSYAMGVLVEVAWDQVKADVPAWRKQVGDAPALIADLGRKHAELREYDEAEKDLRQYIALSPDPWAYRLLADCYRARGQDDRWLATLDEFLARTEPAGLERARLQVDIANDLMKRGRFEQARKYAEDAAETWAGWALICASECNEKLKDWERAELWVKRAAERYPRANGTRWYQFCKRTGHGDLQAARAFADAVMPGAADRPDPARLEEDGYALWANGSAKQALESLEQAARNKPSAANAIAVFLLADELGEKPRRDQLLEELCTKLQRELPRMVAIARMIRDSLANDGKGELDLARIDRILGDMPAKARANAEFLVGRFLFNRGQRESARKYLQLAADSSRTDPGLRQIAIDSLRPPEV